MNGRAHESYEVDTRKLHWIAAIMAAGLIAIVLAMYLLAHFWLHTDEVRPVTSVPPVPRLQTDPVSDLAHERARELGLLHGYAWVDRDAGIARIPIDRAMQILAAHSSRAPGQGTEKPR